MKKPVSKDIGGACGKFWLVRMELGMVQSCATIKQCSRDGIWD